LDDLALLLINKPLKILSKNGLFFIKQTLTRNGHHFNWLIHRLVSKLVPLLEPIDHLLDINGTFIERAFLLKNSLIPFFHYKSFFG
jgi:hypothetical protein